MLTILVVDDEPDLPLLIRQKFRAQILAQQYAFVFAENGKQALHILDERPDIRLLVSDINMPEMDGLSLLRALQTRTGPPVLTIIISAYGDMANIRTAMNLGAFDFVTKPINFPDLNLTVEKAIQQIQQWDQAERNRQQLKLIRHELQVAARIQQAILPRKGIVHPSVEVYGTMQPAREVGGDFYDFCWLNDETVAMVVADVSGKGIPASLFMTVSRTLMRAHMRADISPASCVASVNKLLAQDNEQMMFVTLFYAQLHIPSGTLQYTNAGHNPPVRVHGGQSTWLDKPHGLPLGISAQRPYEQDSLQLNPGDLLFLYTDGLPEATDSTQHFFGNTAMLKLLEDLPDTLSAQACIAQVQTAWENFMQEAAASDDTTLLAIRYHGPQGTSIG